MINTLHLGLSYNCNMKCKHCFVDKSLDNLSLESIKNVIDILDNQGLFFIIYTFGEPMLSNKLWGVSEYVSKKNIIQTMMTNGSLINEKNIIRLKENNINNIYVSLDSVDKLKHDSNRNYKSSYDKAIKTLKLLVSNNFNAGIAVTINDNNIDEMNEFVKLAENLNVKNISFLRQRENGNLKDLNKETEYIEFYKNYISNEKNKINIVFHDVRLLKVTQQLYEDKIISLDKYEKYYDMNSCHNKTTLSIEPNGNIKHCNLINNTIGNININNIEEELKKGCDCNECFISSTKFPK